LILTALLIFELEPVDLIYRDYQVPTRPYLTVVTVAYERDWFLQPWRPSQYSHAACHQASCLRQHYTQYSDIVDLGCLVTYLIYLPDGSLVLRKLPTLRNHQGRSSRPP